MEATIALNKGVNMYNKDSFDPINPIDLTNKLLCTFITPDKLDDLVKQIFTSYDIMHKKVFILSITDSDEYACTYNINGTFVKNLIDNTILVHRKKESNTLYTINALNELIKSLNGGIVDSSYQIEWLHYRNTILLTQQAELKMLKTKIFKIVEQ